MMIPVAITLPKVIVYLAIINIVSLGLFAVDKRRASTGGWRIEERNLLLAAFLGGSPGALLGMCTLHHKTRHVKFKIGIPLIMLIQSILIIYCLKL